MRTLMAIVGVLALAGCAPAPEPAATANNSTAAAVPAPEALPSTAPAPANALTATGWGPLAIGMTRAEIVKALGDDADPGAVGGPEPEACDQFRPARAPAGMLVMLEDGKLTRISVSEPGVRTGRGLQVGDSAAAVKQAYGDALVVQPHKYVEAPAQYLTAWTGTKPAKPDVDDPAARGVRYETDDKGKVTMIHAGGPSIQYIEGCL